MEFEASPALHVGLSDLTTMIRGTLRFEGFSYVMSAMRQAGLFSGERIPEKVRNWVRLDVNCALNGVHT